MRDEAWPDAGQRRRAARRAGLARLPRRRGGGTAGAGWAGWLAELARDQRVARLHREAGALWITAERLPQFRALWPDAGLDPAIAAPGSLCRPRWSPDEALVEILRGRLEGLGPVAEDALAAPLGLGRRRHRRAADGARSRGFRAARALHAGHRRARNGASAGCSPASIATRSSRLRAEIEPVAARDFLRFLLAWQRVAPDARMEGPGRGRGPGRPARRL